MRQIRPTIDELKKRYSCALARRKMTERRHAARPKRCQGRQDPRQLRAVAAAPAAHFGGVHVDLPLVPKLCFGTHRP